MTPCFISLEWKAFLRIDDTYLRIMCQVLDEHHIDSRQVLAQAGLPRRLPSAGMTTTAETSKAFRRAFAAVTDRQRELWPIVGGSSWVSSERRAVHGCTGIPTSAPVPCLARTSISIDST